MKLNNKVLMVTKAQYTFDGVKVEDVVFGESLGEGKGRGQC